MVPITLFNISVLPRVNPTSMTPSLTPSPQKKNNNNKYSFEMFEILDFGNVKIFEILEILIF